MVATPLSLRLRLILLTGLLTGVTLLLFALVFYLFLQANLLREIDAQLQERAALVTHRLAASDDLEGQVALLLPSPLGEFATPGLYVVLLSAEGHVRAASPNLPGGRLPLSSVLLAATHTGQTTIDTVEIAADEEIRLLVMPLQGAGWPGDVLLVAESLEPLQRTLAQAHALLLVCGAAALALAIGGTALLTARSLAPMAGVLASSARSGKAQRL
jgi:two-component system OmpR family sensor kinase